MLERLRDKKMSGGHFYNNNLSMNLEQLENELRWQGGAYNETTQKALRECLKTIRKAQVCLHRVDYLFSGDDGEESFVERLEEDLKEVRKNAAIREFEEETGIDLGPYKERVGLLGTFNPNPAYFNNHMSIFCVKVPDLLERFQNRNKQNLDENEDCRVFVDRVLNRYWDLSSHAMGIAALQKMAITPVDALEYCEAIPKQPK
jgi:hypothetical protein